MQSFVEELIYRTLSIFLLYATSPHDLDLQWAAVVFIILVARAYTTSFMYGVQSFHPEFVGDLLTRSHTVTGKAKTCGCVEPHTKPL